MKGFLYFALAAILAVACCLILIDSANASPRCSGQDHRSCPSILESNAAIPILNMTIHKPAPAPSVQPAPAQPSAIKAATCGEGARGRPVLGAAANVGQRVGKVAVATVRAPLTFARRLAARIVHPRRCR